MIYFQIKIKNVFFFLRYSVESIYKMHTDTGALEIIS